MKVKNKDIMKLVNMRFGEKKFPAAMQLAIVGNEEAITGALKAYSKVYNEIAEEHAKKDEDGNPIKDESGNMPVEDTEAWNKALEELDDAEIEVSITMIPRAVFERCCDDPAFDTPSVSETSAMSFFIEKE